MYNYLQYVQSLCSLYTEQTASGLPNPTPVEGKVRFFQAQDQPSVTTHVRVGNRVFSHSLDVVSKNAGYKSKMAATPTCTLKTHFP